jgi:hypothetical protein
MDLSAFRRFAISLFPIIPDCPCAEHLKSEIIDTKTTMESKVEHGTL